MQKKWSGAEEIASGTANGSGMFLSRKKAVVRSTSSSISEERFMFRKVPTPGWS